MNSSFSLRRFGVISRISSARCSVCFGGSNVGSWSLNGSSSRCCSMSVADVVALERPASGTTQRVVLDAEPMQPLKEVVAVGDRRLELLGRRAHGFLEQGQQQLVLAAKYW